MSVVRSVPWLESVDAKLDRAHEHLDIINRQIDDFLKSAKSTFVYKHDPDSGEAWLVWWVEEPSHPPLTLSVEIGEFLYNARSALDNLICALVRTNEPSSSCSGRSFPIYTDGDTYTQKRSDLLRGVPPSAKTLIGELQPYMRGPQTAEVDPLNILNTLRNRDTHRALNLAVGYTRDNEVLISDSTGKPLAHIPLPQSVLFADGSQTIPIPIRAADLPPLVNVQAVGRAGLAFRDEGPWSDRTVDRVLVTCLEHVEDRVIARFKPFFGH